MTDPKAVDVLSVLRDGIGVGTISRTGDGAIFRYSTEFLASSQEPIALHLPKDPGGTEARGTTNLPAFFAGLLPEGIVQEAIVRASRLSRDDLFSQLAITGFDAVGDITIRIPGELLRSGLSTPSEVKVALRALLAGHSNLQLSAVSGVQPKLSIGQAVASSRGTVAIVKIEPEQYPGILVNESYFMGLARRAGLRAAEVKLQEETLVVRRFDRVKRKGQPPGQIHVEDALQVMNRYPFAKYSLDYTEIMETAARLEVARAVQLDLLRLYAFSFVIGNGDLHAKNVSFEYQRAARRWLLTPAYDLVCTLPYFASDAFGRHMALPLEEQYGAFVAEDFRKVGARFDLPAKAIDSMLREVVHGVRAGLSESAPPVGAEFVDEILHRASGLDPL